MKIVFLILIISTEIFALNVDSLKNEYPLKKDAEQKLRVLNSIIGYYKNLNYDSTKKFNEIFIDVAKKNKIKKHIARGYSNASFYYLELGLNYKALAYADSAISLYNEINEDIYRAFTSNTKARIFETQGNSDSAYYYFSTALDILNADSTEHYLEIYSKDKNGIDRKLKGISIVMTDFALFKLSLNKVEEAEKMFNELIVIAKTMNDDKRLAGTYSNLGMLYEGNKLSEKALEYYNKAIIFADKSNSLIYKTSILNNIGVILTKSEDKEDWKKANACYLESAKIAESFGDKKSYIFYKLNYARNLSKLNKLTKALSVTDSLKVMIEKVEDLKLWSMLYRTNARIYSNSKNFEKAYENELKYQTYNDSLISEKSMEQINILQVALDSERKDNQIKLLKSEKELLGIRMYFILGLIIFILILTAVLYSRYRIKNKAYSKIEKMNKKLVESEKELKELNATKDKFFSIIAHDLKGPIGIYNNVLEFIDKEIDKFSKDEIKEFIFDMKESSSRLFIMLEDLLSWARSQTGKINFTPERNNFKEIIKNNIAVLSLSAENKNIQLTNLLHKDIYELFDASMITTVIRNLLSNAIKFTESGGKIVLNAEETDEDIVFSIKDNGVGISYDKIDKLFGIETHFTSKGTNDEKGTGLGLILCKEFIDKHNGKIWVESEEGRGSEFFFSIPKTNMQD